VGRVSVGPEIGYSLVRFGGRVEPFAFVALDCDFGSRPGIVAINGVVIADRSCGGRAGGGVKRAYGSSLSGSVSAAYNSIGRPDQNSWTLQGRVQVNF